MSLKLIDSEAAEYTLPLTVSLESDSLGQPPSRQGYAQLNAPATWAWTGKKSSSPLPITISGELGSDSFANLAALQVAITNAVASAVQLQDTFRSYYVAVDSGVVTFAHQRDPFTCGLVMTLWPTGGTWGDISAPALWLETADYILQETGDQILRE